MATTKQLKAKYRRKEIMNKFLKGLVLTGAVYMAAGSP